MTLLSDDTISFIPAYGNHAQWDCESRADAPAYVERMVHENYSRDELICEHLTIDIWVTFRPDRTGYDTKQSPSDTITIRTEMADTADFFYVYNGHDVNGWYFFIPHEAVSRIKAGESADDVLTKEEKAELDEMYLEYLAWGLLESDSTNHSVAFSYGQVMGQEKVVFVLPKFFRYFDWESDGEGLTWFKQDWSADFLETMELCDTLKALFAQVQHFSDPFLFGKVLNVLGIRVEVGEDTLYGWYEGDDLETKAVALTELLIAEHKEEFPEGYESEDDDYDEEYDEDDYADEDEVSEEVDAQAGNSVSEYSEVKS